MFDFAKTLNLLRGGVFKPEAVWQRFLGEKPTLQHTAVVLFVPLLLSQVVLNLIISRIFGGFHVFGWGMSLFPALILGLIAATIGFAIATAAMTLLAPMFGGRSDWSQGFAAMALAYIPYSLAAPVGAFIPYLGWLIALAGGILSLVYLYRIIPLALGVKEDKRPFHFIASLVASFIANLIVVSVLGLGAANQGSLSGNGFDRYVGDQSGQESDSERGAGMFGELERQGKLVEAAEQDRYQAPDHGKLSEKQVERLISVMDKTHKLQKREEERLQKLAKEMENKEQASIGDLTRMFQGVGSAVGMHNAEMEVVKTGGGNWAEHQWVKEQLRIAMIQQDGSEAIEHNYALYEKYAEQLQDMF